ncbi:unnamed protein product, partial [Mesorhabditis belari]|uniref:Battenin n=1 Tax=Mesorhabditis belari TaxID=2138241 RepID=A0AAF3ER99_9BILA
MEATHLFGSKIHNAIGERSNQNVKLNVDEGVPNTYWNEVSRKMNRVELGLYLFVAKLLSKKERKREMLDECKTYEHSTAFGISRMSTDDIKKASFRTIFAFWILGICNNLPHIVMLSAAGDIIDKGHRHSQIVQLSNSTQNNETCPADRGTKHCDGKQSTGIILLADILPSVLAKIFVMFWAQKVSYQLRHFCVVSLQFAALLIVAFADSYFWAIFGVVLQSIAGGVGESTLVSYSSHFSHSTTVAWTSGTGAVGILGSFLYASLTEPHLANLSPKTAFLVMLIFPIAFAVAFWMILDHSKNIFHYCKKYIVVDASSHEPKPNSNENAKVEQRPTTLWQKVCLIKPLLRWLIPLMCIYLAEYMINQGFIQLVVFDCSTGLHLSKTSQYRWFQFIYRTGSFISKSSLGLLDFPVWVLYLLPVLQIGNAIFFYFEALLAFVPHILIAFVIIFVAGLYGGSSLAKTLNHIHKTVPSDVREFSLAVACTSDAVGIVMAAFAAILFHNVICSQIG